MTVRSQARARALSFLTGVGLVPPLALALALIDCRRDEQMPLRWPLFRPLARDARGPGFGEGEWPDAFSNAAAAAGAGATTGAGGRGRPAVAVLKTPVMAGTATGATATTTSTPATTHLHYSHGHAQQSRQGHGHGQGQGQPLHPYYPAADAASMKSLEVARGVLRSVLADYPDALAAVRNALRAARANMESETAAAAAAAAAAATAENRQGLALQGGDSGSGGGGCCSRCGYPGRPPDVGGPDGDDGSGLALV
jgi:hypothetical protein